MRASFGGEVATSHAVCGHGGYRPAKPLFAARSSSAKLVSEPISDGKLPVKRLLLTLKPRVMDVSSPSSEGNGPKRTSRTGMRGRSGGGVENMNPRRR